MNAKRWIALVIALGIFGVSIIVSISMSFFESVKGAQTDLTSLTDESQEKTLENGSPSSKIAVLEVSGTIQDNGDSSSLLGADGYNHRTFLKNLERAKDDKTVKGIVLKVNSPGGGVYESAEIHKKLEEIKKETKKPIYVSMGSMAASGGYYISTAADKIFATPETLTGSLGVIMESVNYSKLAFRYVSERRDGLHHHASPWHKTNDTITMRRGHIFNRRGNRSADTCHDQSC